MMKADLENIKGKNKRAPKAYIIDVEGYKKYKNRQDNYQSSRANYFNENINIQLKPVNKSKIIAIRG